MDKEWAKQKIVDIINDGIIRSEDNYSMPTNKTVESIADNIIKKVLQVQFIALRNAIKAQDCLSCYAFLNDKCNYMDKNGCERNSDECINNILAQSENELYGSKQ